MTCADLSIRMDYAILHPPFSYRHPRMKDPEDLQSRQFDALLTLFSDDREEAGVSYEAVRRSLVQYFLNKQCDHAEQLADETLNRVARKVDSFDRTRNIRPTTFVLGFASRVYLEYRRGPDRLSVPIDSERLESAEAPSSSLENEEELECLDACLQKLPVEDRELIIKYYSRERSERVKLRRDLAEFLGVAPEVLHVRVYRLRQTLRKCVNGCVGKKSR